MAAAGRKQTLHKIQKLFSNGRKKCRFYQHQRWLFIAMNFKFTLHFYSVKHTFFLQDYFSTRSMEWGINLWNYIMWVSFTLGQGKKWIWICPLSINIPNLHLLNIIAFLYLSFSCVSKKKRSILKKYCRYLRIHFGEDLTEEILYGLRYLTAVMGEVLVLQSVPGCLRGAAHWTDYMVCFLSSTLPSLNPLLNCPSAMSCLLL